MRRRICPYFCPIDHQQVTHPKVYIPALRDVHAVATAPIPVATGPVLGPAKPFSAPEKPVRLCQNKTLMLNFSGISARKTERSRTENGEIPHQKAHGFPQKRKRRERKTFPSCAPAFFVLICRFGYAVQAPRCPPPRQWARHAAALRVTFPKTRGTPRADGSTSP